VLANWRRRLSGASATTTGMPWASASHVAKGCVRIAWSIWGRAEAEGQEVRRRWLILVAVVALGTVAGWIGLNLSAGLSPEEQALIGVWREKTVVPSQSGFSEWEFSADRSFRSTLALDFSLFQSTATWCLREGVLVLDGEPNPFRRVLRPLSRWVNVQPVFRIGNVTIAGDRMTVDEPNGSQLVWTRTPAD